MRRSQFDNGSQPVRNLFTNPGAETSGGSLLVRRNLCANPKAEAVGGVTTTIRTNLINNPTFATNTTGWGANTSNLTLSHEPTMGYPDATGCAKAVYNVQAAGDINTVNSISVAAPGKTYTASAYVMAPGGASTMTITLDFRDANTAALTGGSIAQATSTPGPWTRISVTGTAPAGTAKVFIRIGYTFGPPVGWTYYTDSVLLEETAYVNNYFDGSTTKFNLCPNPSLETNTNDWGWWVGADGAGNAARLATGGYRGAAHYRVTWTTSQTGSVAGGIYTDTPVTPGVTYSVRAAARANRNQKVRIKTEWINPARNAQTGQASGVDYDLTTNVWRELTEENLVPPDGTGWLRTTIYSAPLGTAWLAGDTLDMDAVMVTVGPTAMPYEESTETTFTWTSTAHASTSVQRVTSAPGYGGANNCIAYRTGIAGGYAIRGLFTTNAVSDSGISFAGSLTSVAPNTTYTISCDVLTDRTRPMKLSIQGGGVTGLPVASFTATGGLVTRQSITFISSATAGTGNLPALYLLRGDTQAGWVDMDNVLIEPASVTKPYFDGTTPAAGDFTYSWLGAAHGSESRQLSTGLTIFGAGANSASIRSSEWSASGANSLRIHPNNHSTTQDTFAYVSTSPLTPGTWTILATLRIETPITTTDDRSRRIVAYHSNKRDQGDQAPNVPGVYPLRLTFTITDAAAYQSYRLYHGGANGQPDVWWDNIMIVEGEYRGDYINPDQNPLAKWDGTAGASASIGYPPQLLDIAGKPELDISMATTNGTLGGGFGNQEGRTFYTVFETTNLLTTTIDGIAAYGTYPFGDGTPDTFITLRQQSSSDPIANGILSRRTGGGGALAGGGTKARHVAAWGIDDTGKMFTSMDGKAEVTDAAIMTLPHQGIQVYADTSDHKHFRTIMYRGKHDAATRAAVARYLGNKYGANVA